MPHIVGRDIKSVKYPISISGYKYLFEVKNETTSLVACEFQNKLFFIQVKKQNNSNYIIKGEKTTRPSPVNILQNALYLYANIALEDIVKSNIKYTEFKLPENIKHISFFSDFIEKNKNKKLELEIGFGSGRHILNLARNNPNTNYIGLEIYKPSLDQVSKLIEINQLNNIYLCDYDARSFIKNLPLNSLNAIYVHFPVPWDKKPLRRVFSKDFINSANMALNENGRLNLRTDSIKYYEFVLSIFEKMNLKIESFKNKGISTTSKYEDRWLKMEKDIYDVIYEKQGNKYYDNYENEFIFDKIEKYPDIISIENKYIKKDYGFIKFKRTYYKDNRTIVPILYGDENLHESRFLHIQDMNISYFPNSPTKHSLNYKLHKVINNELGNKYE